MLPDHTFEEFALYIYMGKPTLTVGWSAYPSTGYSREDRHIRGESIERNELKGELAMLGMMVVRCSTNPCPYVL